MYGNRIYKCNAVYGRAMYNIVRTGAGISVCCLAPSQLSVCLGCLTIAAFGRHPVDVRVSG